MISLLCSKKSNNDNLCRAKQGCKTASNIIIKNAFFKFKQTDIENHSIKKNMLNNRKCCVTRGHPENPTFHKKNNPFYIHSRRIYFRLNLMCLNNVYFVPFLPLSSSYFLHGSLMLSVHT